MIKHYFFAPLLFLSTCAFGQESGYSICDCCTYSIFQFKDDYTTLFPPTTIKANGIRELTIYTTSRQSSTPKDTTFKVIDKEYKEMIFRFNANGYVETQIVFNRRGQYHSVYDFIRDNNNNILARAFHYLDSTGKKVEDFLPDKWVYTYAGGHLVKVKKLDDKFTEQPDAKSDYTTYDYDRKGRVVTGTRQLYYDWTEPTYYQTQTTYNDTTNTSVAVTRDKKQLFSIVKIQYAKNQEPLNQKFIDGRTNRLLEERIFTYDSAGQLAKLQVKSSGLGTECPDGGNFENTYTYSPLQLISHIRHHYKNTVCELRLVYK